MESKMFSSSLDGNITTTTTSNSLSDDVNNISSNNNDFENFYHGVCGDLQSRGEVHNMSKLFGGMKDDGERIKFVLEESRQHLEVWKKGEFNFTRKDRNESGRYRNSGNQVYQKNKLKEALSAYSYSICYAPHPPPPNSFLLHNLVNNPPGDHEESYEELALGYANRSAVLFQLKEYELCIRDITRAFDNSYPNNLMYKLFERKSRCLMALKDYPRALEAMKNAAMWMKYSTLSETKNSSFKKEIAKQVDFLEEKVARTDISEFSEGEKDFKKVLIAPVKVLETPNIDKTLGINDKVPCVRADVELKYSSEKGRYLVANQDIEPGEILITETPYSAILLPEYYNTHCQSCFHRIIAPIPCWCCAKVRFCSDECRVEAWERFHKVECQQLNLILDAGVGKNAMLAMRILTSSGKIYLEYVINKVKEESEARKATMNPSEAECLSGFNEDNIYDAADYRTLFTLVTNSKQRGVGDLFKRSLMAVYLLKILEMTPFFFNGGSDPRNVKLGDKVTMGALILRHLQNLPCNAHEVSELEINGSNVRDSTVHEIGAAAYGTLSLLNHSCDPNVVRHYYSCNAVVRSVRRIKKGEEILDNYGYHYAVMHKEERQRKLYNQYYFHCNCNACTSNWPTYPHVSSNPVYLANADNQAKIDSVTKSSKVFKKAFDNVLQGQFDESLPLLLDHLKLLDSYVSRPFREYNDCQEAIKQCYSVQANSVKINNSNKKDSSIVV